MHNNLIAGFSLTILLMAAGAVADYFVTQRNQVPARRDGHRLPRISDFSILKPDYLK